MSTVNALVAWLGSAALAAAVALVFGSGLLRLLGVAAMVVSMTFLLAEASQDTADLGSYLVFVPMALSGFGVWVLGHRLFAAQHRYWKSTLAAALWNAAAARPARSIRARRRARARARSAPDRPTVPGPAPAVRRPASPAGDHHSSDGRRTADGARSASSAAGGTGGGRRSSCEGKERSA